MTRSRRARAPTRTGAAVLTGLVAATFLLPAGAHADGPPLAAPMPDPAVIAQGVSSGNPAHLFKDPAWDFAAMRKVFNAVSLLPGDQSMVDAARRAGLAVVLEFDDKADFFAGKDIGAKVAAVADQIDSHPGTIAAVHVADRLDERYSAEQGLRYLAATGGVLHRLAPGVPVLVNASDWELTCGLPGQSSCGSHGTRYQYETDATLDAFASSGFVDGISIADNLKNLDASAQVVAWQRARARWPKPFLLWATCSQLSFGDSVYGGAPDASAATRAYMLVPVGLGADAVALWAWHQEYQGAVYTFLDKGGSPNAMWASMSAAAARIDAAPADPAELARIPAATRGPGGAAFAVVGLAVLAGFAVLAGLLAGLKALQGRRAPVRARVRRTPSMGP